MSKAPLPDAILALGPDTVATVEAMVAAAEERQLAEADAALDTALKIVPRPARGIVRKVLLG